MIAFVRIGALRRAPTLECRSANYGPVLKTNHLQLLRVPYDDGILRIAQFSRQIHELDSISPVDSMHVSFAPNSFTINSFGLSSFAHSSFALSSFTVSSFARRSNFIGRFICECKANQGDHILSTKSSDRPKINFKKC